jgi:hypothetical protein
LSPLWKEIHRHPNSIIHQSTSPLYAIIPAELRNEIFAEALRGYVKQSDYWDRETHYTRPGYEGKSTVEVALLCTCRQVYLETHQTVKKVNGYDRVTFWLYRSPEGVRCGPHAMPNLKKIEMERLQEITSVHLLMQQYFMEGHALASMLAIFRNELPDLRTIRVTVRHSDWWYWESNDKLGMDPFSEGRVSHGAVCSKLDDLRQNPRKYIDDSVEAWGNRFVGLDRLQKFELELETLVVKKRQLDKIVEFSRYWALPILSEKDSERVLIRDPEEKWSGWDGPSSFLVPNLDQTPYTQDEIDKYPYLRYPYQVVLLTWRPGVL